jgi:penicillin-binding protein activator
MHRPSKETSMKKLFFPLVFIALIACTGAVVHKINFAKDFSASTIKRIAILNFNRGTDVRINQDITVDKFTAALVGSRFVLVDRSDIKKIMEEAKFQHSDSGIIDEKTKKRLQQLGADTILTGTLHTYTENKNAQNLILYSEVYLTAKLLRVETGEVLWSAEILESSKVKNIGEKKRMGVIGGETEALSAGKLLDNIISDMADSFKEKKKFLNIL